MNLPQAGPPIQSAFSSGAVADCWNRIGVAGDRSCPELSAQVHCRNCPVFAAAARTFFDRPPPEGYLDEWTRRIGVSGDHFGAQLEDRGAGGGQSTISVLIFRLGCERLAFLTRVISEVTLPRTVHRIPHRSNAILIGLVNLRGELQLCVSLHGLIGVEAAPSEPPSALQLRTGSSPELSMDRSAETFADPSTRATERLIVVRDRRRSESWIFAADEVLGVHRIPAEQVRTVSSSLANPEVSFSQAILSWSGLKVALLDEERIFAALQRIAQ
jgi:chemotaxis-related protein WspD